MTQRNSKTTFTEDEQRQLIYLVSDLEKADSTKKKNIRNKIRKIGLYWSEVGSGDYTVANLKRLFGNGTLKLIESNIDHQNYTRFSEKKEVSVSEKQKIANTNSGRRTSDEHYVIDLCDEIIGQTAMRQHRFDFLRGDSGVPLPVDAYYPNINLVIEYHESQHTQSTPFF